MPKELVIRQRKSAIGEKQEAKRTLRALGLRKLNHSVVRPDAPTVRGMLSRVAHLVQVQERNA